MVELGWWLRHLESNFDTRNYLGLPKDFSGNIEYLLIPLLLAYVLMNLKHLGHYVRIVEVLFVFIVINLCTSFLTGETLFASFQLTSKLMSPVMLFLVLIIKYKKGELDIGKLAKRFLYLCIFLILIALLLFNPSSNRGPQHFLPIYFESIHTHSYILVSLFIIISFPLFIRKRYITLISFFVVSFLFIWFGYAVRTAIIVYLIYMLIVLFYMNVFFKYLWVKAIIYVPIIVFFFSLFATSFSLDDYSSGRLSMYSAKIDQISKFNIFEVLFGQGHGSDLIRTDFWAFGKKGSHSDVITYFVENGILFLLFYFYLLFVLVWIRKKVSLIYLFLIIGYFVSSLVSNGITSRPLSGYLFFIALAVVLFYQNPSILKNNEAKSTS